METYDDIWQAYGRAEHLNKVEGQGKYCVTGDVDGQWVVRLRASLNPRPLAPEMRRLKNWIRQLAHGHPNAVLR